MDYMVHVKGITPSTIQIPEISKIFAIISGVVGKRPIPELIFGLVTQW